MRADQPSQLVLLARLGRHGAGAQGEEEPIAAKEKGPRRRRRKTAEAEPSRSVCLVSCGVMLYGYPQNDDLAVDLYKNALKAFPNSSHAYQAWALLEKDRGNFELAFKVSWRAGPPDQLGRRQQAKEWEAWPDRVCCGCGVVYVRW